MCNFTHCQVRWGRQAPLMTAWLNLSIRCLISTWHCLQYFFYLLQFYVHTMMFVFSGILLIKCLQQRMVLFISKSFWDAAIKTIFPYHPIVVLKSRLHSKQKGPWRAVWNSCRIENTPTTPAQQKTTPFLFVFSGAKSSDIPPSQTSSSGG